MKLQLLENMNSQDWDDTIERFETKYVFHQSAWLDFLEETQHGEILRFAILDNEKIEGYFVGLKIRKGPISILGSPLKGWTTHYMGPIVNQGVSLGNFIAALDKVCKRIGIHHIEIGSPILDPQLMKMLQFRIEETHTYIVSLSSDENQMWENLNSKCRNKIRQAMKNGLRVELCSDPVFVDDYYGQLIEVFARQRLVPTYSIERVRSLFRNLQSKWLIAIRIAFEDKVIATGLFPHDNNCMIFWGGASLTRFQKLRPNELLHWSAMKLAATRGLRYYDMGGQGSFKPKFGGEMTPVYHYFKSYSSFVKIGREAYRAIFYARQKIKGKLLRF